MSKRKFNELDENEKIQIMNSKNEGKTKTIKIRKNNGNEREFEMKGITHVVLLQKIDVRELFFIKNEITLEFLKKNYKE
jgi:hypothetical protein